MGHEKQYRDHVGKSKVLCRHLEGILRPRVRYRSTGTGHKIELLNQCHDEETARYELSLIEDLQSAALDESLGVSQLLRKTYIAACKLEEADLSIWARRELDGYDELSTVPSYRRIRMEVKGLNRFHGWMPVDLAPFPEFGEILHVPMAQGLPSLEETLGRCGNAKNVRVSMIPALQSFLIEYVGRREYGLFAPRPSVDGILHAVRDRVIQWTTQRGSPTNTMESIETTVSAPGVQSIYHFHGSVGTAQIMQNSTNSMQTIRMGESDLQDQITAFVRRTRSWIDDIELPEPVERELRAELTTIEAQAASPNPKLSILKESVGSIRRVLEGSFAKAGGSVLFQIAEQIYSEICLRLQSP